MKLSTMCDLTALAVITAVCVAVGAHTTPRQGLHLWLFAGVFVVAGNFVATWRVRKAVEHADEFDRT